MTTVIVGGGISGLAAARALKNKGHEFVVLEWRLGEQIVELPIRIEELRPSPVSIRRRLPMVLDLIRQSRASLKRIDTPRSQNKSPKVVDA
jgi:2-polyprenyl-6-methoxyphenol hydroxylase-like FAD-dependent oxidoreductase